MDFAGESEGFDRKLRADRIEYLRKATYTGQHGEIDARHAEWYGQANIGNDQRVGVTHRDDQPVEFGVQQSGSPYG